MPIYQYACMGCHNEIERMAKMPQRNDPPECENCGKKMFRKWVFKGSTWAPTSTGSNHK